MKGRADPVGLGAAALTVFAAVATPAIPWHAAPILLVLAAVAAADRHWIWAALGAAVVWVSALGGDAGGFVLAGAVVLGAARWRALATVVLATGCALAVKQELVVGELAASAGVVPWLLASSVAASGAAAAARPGRIPAIALGIAGLAVAARLGAVFSFDGAARLEAAERMGAVPLVYDRLAADADPDLAAALVRAAPGRDAAALRLGWERALDLGWRPSRADGVVVPVARALEARGRGGEALRLLARHSREADVDAFRALLERLQGVPVGWRGAGLGPELPGRFDPAIRLDTNGYAAVEFIARTPLDGLRLTGEGSAFEGPARVEVTLDAAQPVPWDLDGPGELALPGPVEPGPHRLGFRFVNDRVGAGGDRNVRIGGVEGEASGFGLRATGSDEKAPGADGKPADADGKVAGSDGKAPGSDGKGTGAGGRPTGAARE